jgi:hypothetical protein
LTFTPFPNVTPWVPSGQVWRYYYYTGNARVAMRVKDPTIEQVYYLFAGHLGSTNVTSNPAGSQVGLGRVTPVFWFLRMLFPRYFLYAVIATCRIGLQVPFLK